MNGDICIINECGDTVVNQGRICNWHRYAKRKYGSFDAERVGHKVQHSKSRVHDGAHTRKNLFYSMTLFPDLNGCMNWIGSKNNKGYGQINISGRPMLAHRYSYALFNGEYNKNWCVLHKCDNPSCVAPEHLFLGTKKDNMQDCKNKGRIFIPKSRENPLSNHAKKLIIMFIKQGIPCTQIASAYQVNSSIIYRLKNKANYDH